MSVKFADHDDHFYLKNASVNEGYFHDSVHLTVKGANKLASSLSVMTVTEDPKVGVCSYKLTQSFCFDHKSSQSSDTDLSHSFWNTAKRKFNNARKQNNERHRTQQTTPSGHPKCATHTAGNFPTIGRSGTVPQSPSHQQPRPEMRSGNDGTGVCSNNCNIDSRPGDRRTVLLPIENHTILMGVPWTLSHKPVLSTKLQLRVAEVLSPEPSFQPRT